MESQQNDTSISIQQPTQDGTWVSPELSPSTDMSEEDESFGTLLHIRHASLIALAVSVLKTRSSKKYTVKGPITGSSNVIYIVQLKDEKCIIRIPGTGWGGNFSDIAKRAFVADVLTMRYIHAHMKTFPMPKIMDYDPSTNNVIGAPYLVMDFVHGTTVADMWFDSDLKPPDLEARRLKILKSIANAMSRFSSLTFHGIGSLEFDSNGSIFRQIGPCYDVEDKKKLGPFTTSQAYTSAIFDDVNRKFALKCGAERILKWMVTYLPHASTPSNDRFVLSHPDLDSQNIMVDDEGNVTGILDWDGVQTVPDYLGYQKFPSWITRDWNPLVYEKGSDTEDSPKKLEKYRKFYTTCMNTRLQDKNDKSVKYTSKSHVFEAVVNAASDETCRLEIAMKFLREAHSKSDLTEDWEWSLDMVRGLGENRMSKKKRDSMKKKLKTLLTA